MVVVKMTCSLLSPHAYNDKFLVFQLVFSIKCFEVLRQLEWKLKNESAFKLKCMEIAKLIISFHLMLLYTNNMSDEHVKVFLCNCLIIVFSLLTQLLIKRFSKWYFCSLSKHSNYVCTKFVRLLNLVVVKLVFSLFRLFKYCNYK